VPIVEKSVFKRVERELYTYHQNLRDQANRRLALLHSTPRPDSIGRSEGHVSDPSQVKGVNLAAISESEQARWLNVIHDAFHSLPTDYKMLIKFKYFDKYRNEVVADKLHISRSRFYEWRENIVLYIVLLATQRGLIKPIKEKEAG